MGSSSSCNHNHTDNINHEKFNFRFTDCSCQCTANKKLVNNNEQSQTMIFNALMKSTIRPQYDINCNCDCGEGVKLGFLFGNTQQELTDK